MRVQIELKYINPQVRVVVPTVIAGRVIVPDEANEAPQVIALAPVPVT